MKKEKVIRTIATAQAYPKFAFCSAITPADPEYYEHLKAAGIDTASVCLHLSGYEHYKFATIHTDLARRAGMTTHAFLVTDLTNIYEDMIHFTRRYNQLNYCNGDRLLSGFPRRNRLRSRGENMI